MDVACRLPVFAADLRSVTCSAVCMQLQIHRLVGILCPVRSDLRPSSGRQQADDVLKCYLSR